MSKVISYSIYGYGKARNENSLDFNSYLRGLSKCLRMNRLLYPEWKTIIHTDGATYEAFRLYFEGIKNENVEVVKCAEAPLCMSMLWRLKPIFERVWDSVAGGYTDWKYTHIICRDVDSPATYREVQAVDYWIANGKAAHAITDSVSHVIPMLGGMIGFMPKYFAERLNVESWNELVRRGGNIDYSVKGSDQDFLNKVVYPSFARQGQDSITQHYFNGHPNSFLSDYRTCTCPPPAGHRSDCPNDYKINLPDGLKESNSICGHIGSAGDYQSAFEKFIRKYRDRFDDLYSAEQHYPHIFYWFLDKSLG